MSGPFLVIREDHFGDISIGIFVAKSEDEVWNQIEEQCIGRINKEQYVIVPAGKMIQMP